MRQLITFLACGLLLACISYLSWPMVAEVPSTPRGTPRETRQTKPARSFPVSVDEPADDYSKATSEPTI